MERISALFQKYYDKTATLAEREELMELLAEAPAGHLQQLVEQAGIHLTETDDILSQAQEDAILKTIIRKPAAKPYLNAHWLRYAAVLLLIIGAAVYLYITPSFRPKPSLSQIPQTPKAGGISPGGNKAILTLADGSIIILDSVANGNLASQGSTKILKLDAGSIAYQGGSQPEAAGYNTVSTPKGGQYQVVLPDGTKVWLNAASSIRFPTAFTGGERRVEVQGEAYMEVKGHAEQPFYVAMNGMEVQVLGTSFNVNAYHDEGEIRTTLLDGSISVVSGNRPAERHLLQPGEQVLLNTSAGKTKLLKNVNTGKVMAWKNGLFDFDGVGMEELMRQVARWYDIQVVYEKGIPDKEFVGKINRNSSLETLLKALEYTNVRFRIGGRKIIVLPDNI